MKIHRKFLCSVLLAAAFAASSQAALNVKLTLAERHSDSRTGEPVTSGVPLPQGQFKDVSKLRLVDDKGNEVPCQFTPTVKWFRDGSIRWVLLDFQASVTAFSTRTFYLRDDGPAKPIVETPLQRTTRHRQAVGKTRHIQRFAAFAPDNAKRLGHETVFQRRNFMRAGHVYFRRRQRGRFLDGPQ